MERESKLGYGFMVSGCVMAYLLDHLLGPTAGLIAIPIFAAVGIVFLCLGHLHPAPNGESPTALKRISTWGQDTKNKTDKNETFSVIYLNRQPDAPMISAIAPQN